MVEKAINSIKIMETGWRKLPGFF